jgi:hypothetical protein
MKTLALLAFAALAAAAPSFAQEFFGITSSEMQAMIGQAKADEHLQRLKALGQSPSTLAPVGKALGFTKTLTSRRDCVFDAVEARLGINAIRYGTEFPDVLYASETDASRYQAAVKAQYPASNPTREISTIYLSDYNVIYLADSSRAYEKGSTIDAALAGQYARFLDMTQRDVRDPARLDADAAAVTAWYDAQYPAGRSSCSR